MKFARRLSRRRAWLAHAHLKFTYARNGGLSN
jgi:hypothetical protein